MQQMAPQRSLRSAARAHESRRAADLRASRPFLGAARRWGLRKPSPSPPPRGYGGEKRTTLSRKPVRARRQATGTGNDFPYCRCIDYSDSSSPFVLALEGAKLNPATGSTPRNYTVTFNVVDRVTPPNPSECYERILKDGAPKVEIMTSKLGPATRGPGRAPPGAPPALSSPIRIR